jgi:large subunit ribosomal protein L4
MKTTTPTIAKKKSVSLDAAIYSQSGTAAGTIALPEKVFGLAWNADLVHQVVTSMMANKRAGTAHTKDRSEVSGGGKKPWKQKGTGQARHGSSRSPIWVHGGITFGPRNDKDYSQKINKKMRVKALFTVLSRKFALGKVLFVDGISLAAMKTKDAASVLETFAGVTGFENINHKNKTAVLVALPERNEIIEKSFANLPGVTVTTVTELNAWAAMQFRHIVVVSPTASVEVLSAKLT